MPVPRTLLLVVALGWPAAPAVGRQEADLAREPGPFVLEERVLPGSEVEVLEGTYEVWEDRAAKRGRVIGLHVVVLPAPSAEPRPDPLVFLAGGPGMGATTMAAGLARHWARTERDIVLVDQRGTGQSNPLHCPLADDPNDPQRALEPLFDEADFRSCLEALRARADLTKYTTPIAMDDLAEVLDALGYGEVNLHGGSYGTRAALVFMRRHPERVRTATLMGVAPIAFRNPLYHPAAAQRGIVELLDACAADPDCRTAFPELERELAEVLERLADEPARFQARRADTGREIELVLTRDAFADGLRVMMYTAPTAVQVPLAIHRAHAGDYGAVVRLTVQRQRNLRSILALGMLLCVTCAEDVARIDPDEVEAATAGTLAGPGRVLDQLRVCAFWPQGDVPGDYGEPVRCDAPTLLISGSLDPVTPPEWGEEAARHLPRSLHVVVPGWHGVGGPCVDALMQAFLESGSVEALDTGCVSGMQLPQFSVPAQAPR